MLKPLAQYLCKIPRDSKTEEKLAKVHNIIKEMVDNEPEIENVYKMRTIQENLVPHLLGYLIRYRHIAGNKYIKVNISTKQAETNKKIQIEGQVIDISQGHDEVYAHGIQFYTVDWSFENGKAKEPIHKIHSTFHPHTIKAFRLDEHSLAELDDPSVVITWPDGKLEGDAIGIRGFKYDSKYALKGGGAVLFIDKVSKTDQLQQWKEYVRTNLSNVDYGRSKVANHA